MKLEDFSLRIRLTRGNGTGKKVSRLMLVREAVIDIL
jgi:hypothetical protein